MRRTLGIVSGLCLSVAFASRAEAQPYGPQPGYQPPPTGAPPGYQPAPTGPGGYAPPIYTQPSPPGAAPQPTAPGAPPPQQPGAPGAPAYPAPAGPQSGPPAYPAPAGPPPAGTDAAASASGTLGAQGAIRGPSFETGIEHETDIPEASTSNDNDEELAYRKDSLGIENGLNGATGLLRTYGAGSGAVGTFRFSLLSSYFSGSHFLCPTCEVPNGGNPTASDSATHIGGHLGISATPLPFLEAFLAVHTSASSSNIEQPHLLQVLGDTNFGLKGFIPYEKDSIWSAGGSAEVWVLNGTGQVGIDNANFGLRAIGSADFNNRTNKENRIPLRANLNIGYLFDNSGKLVDSVEASTGHRITRVQRFGLDINRVDSLGIGLGVEGEFPIVRPFLEWTADIPVNRQDHICDLAKRAAGDQCLGRDAKFSSTPSRLTLGARVLPFSNGLSGLGFLAGLDIGTGATSNFIEEVVPEMPWNLYLGVAYAVDTQPKVEIRRVEAPRVVHADLPRETRFVQGAVVEKGSGIPVPDALVKFDGRSLTGMITMADGTFRTGDLDPGTYTFDVSATGYRDGQCIATIPLSGTTPGQPGQPAPPAFGEFGQGAPPGPYTPPPSTPQSPYAGAPPGPYTPPATGGPGVPGQGMGGPTPTATVTCELEAQAKVGNVNGQLRDAETSTAVGGAAVKITDKLGRSLSLTADAAGAFRFENVPPGTVTISAEANGYLRGVTELEVKSRGDVTAQIALTKRPQKPNVVVTDKELKLKKEVHFQHDSAEILPDSMGIIEEAADALRSHPEIANVEIQGHTDDSGTPPYNLRLSSERANAVREALILDGVEPNRLSARGYGQDKPLVPNTNDANRAKNRRVQLMIQK